MMIMMENYLTVKWVHLVKYRKITSSVESLDTDLEGVWADLKKKYVYMYIREIIGINVYFENLWDSQTIE